MYTYPNGLACNASEKKVKLFEKVVPTWLLAFICIGTVIIVNTALNLFDLVLGPAIFLLVIFFWLILCNYVEYALFVKWCRPLENSLLSYNDRWVEAEEVVLNQA